MFPKFYRIYKRMLTFISNQSHQILLKAYTSLVNYARNTYNFGFLTVSNKLSFEGKWTMIKSNGWLLVEINIRKMSDYQDSLSGWSLGPFVGARPAFPGLLLPCAWARATRGTRGTQQTASIDNLERNI